MQRGGGIDPRPNLSTIGPLLASVANRGGIRVRRSWLRLFWLTVVCLGAVAGYLVSSGLGTRLLHQEIETQLSRLLEGPVEIGEVEVHWANGLHVEAREVSVYPNPTPGTPPALRARRVLAWVDLVALLIGRLELSTLVLEGPHLRLVQKQDGSFVGLPLPASPPLRRDEPDERSRAEQIVARIASLEQAASVFADRFRAADRIEVLDGTLSWVGWRDAAEESQGGTERDLRIELINGIGERNWLSDAIAVELSGVFVDGQHVPFPFVVQVGRDEGEPFVWSLDLSRIPLEAAETSLAFIDGIEDLGGTFDVRLRLEGQAGGAHRLAIIGHIDDAKIALRRSQSVLEHERVDVEVEFVIDPGQLRVASAKLSGGPLEIDLMGTIQRPIRAASPMRIEARVLGLRLEGVASYARSLEAESETAFTVARLTDRVTSGRVEYIEAAWSARLEDWLALASGKLGGRPSGFVLSGAFSDVTVMGGPGDLLEDLEGEVEWVDDQIVLRNGNATFRGKPLPQINAVLDGVSHLVLTSASAREITQNPPEIPGYFALAEILRPRNPNLLPPVKAIALAIDRLDHPIFRWPLRDLRVLIEPLRQGFELSIREGTWGGAAMSGEIVWFTDPVSPSLSASLTLSSHPDREEPLESARVPDRWGSGQFEVEFRPRRWLPIQSATGFFRLDGTNLIGDELEIQLANQGTIAARLTLGLESADSVGFDTSFALTDGRFAEVAPFIRLPANLATGSIGATGSIAGRIRPHTSFIAELDGRVRAEASKGRVYMNLPLMFRLAKATEGYNPFAHEDELEYETMTGSFDLNHGVISVENFEIEGPLRVYARADIDTNPKPTTIRAVVGIFIFRKPFQILENLPVLRFFLPGSERGLIGTYFEVGGSIREPEVDALPLQSLMTGVPSAIKAPFKALRFLFDRTVGDS